MHWFLGLEFVISFHSHGSSKNLNWNCKDFFFFFWELGLGDLNFAPLGGVRYGIIARLRLQPCKESS